MNWPSGRAWRVNDLNFRWGKGLGWLTQPSAWNSATHSASHPSPRHHSRELAAPIHLHQRFRKRAGVEYEAFFCLVGPSRKRIETPPDAIYTSLVELAPRLLLQGQLNHTLNCLKRGGGSNETRLRFTVLAPPATKTLTCHFYWTIRLTVPHRPSGCEPEHACDPVGHVFVS